MKSADMYGEQVTWLHGDLDLHIIEARGLPNMDVLIQHARRCFAVCQNCAAPSSRSHAGDEGKGGRDRGVKDHRAKIITSDAYITVCVPQATVARTRVIKNARRPRWDEHFKIPLAHPVVNLEFHVKDNDLFGAELMGIVKIPAQKIATGEPIAEWFPIIAPSGKPPKPDSALHMEMRFIPFEKNPLYRHGIAGDPDHHGVRNTYFPLRKGSSVRLYQDAHVPDGKLPKIELDGGKFYKQEKCWEDTCYAISEAHHLVYIVGWSVFYKIKLVREPTRPLPRGGDLTLGELLKYKSQEGVRILLLIWDDKTSRDIFGIKTVGIQLAQ